MYLEGLEGIDATGDKMLHPKKISLTKKKRLEYAELRSDV